MNTTSVSQFYQEDHGRLDELFREFQTAKPTEFAKAQQLFATFKAGLEQHIAWEETLLFPRFEDKTGMHNSGPTQVMRQEHVLIKGFLNAISLKLAAGNAATDIEENGLVQTLSAHNMKEEHILYPAIDHALSDAERTDVFSQMETSAA